MTELAETKSITLNTLKRHADRVRTDQREIEYLIKRLRREGASWSEIGGSLGVSRQAAWRKYRGADPNATPDVPPG